MQFLKTSSFEFFSMYRGFGVLIFGNNLTISDYVARRPTQSNNIERICQRMDQKLSCFTDIDLWRTTEWNVVVANKKLKDSSHFFLSSEMAHVDSHRRCIQQISYT
mmetsp:Transcript_4283/g.7805  ORF Transcript_4283/g.7805 Transcript_4283/m.7805 type:complete len:106 (-) Transcript_4283:506-823(-)